MAETAPAESHATAGTASQPAVAARRDTGIVRTMKILVIVLGVLLILGFFTVVARLVYLAARSGAPAEAPAGGAGANASLELPAGASVRTVTLSGDRLAVYYDAPSGGGIAVIEIATGRTLARIQLHAPPASAGP